MCTPRQIVRRLALEACARLLPPPPHPRPAFPRRLLLIRPDHLGDLLLASPALAELRQALPEAHLTLLVGPWSETVARRGPEVDRILTCEFPGFARRPKPHLLDPYLLLLRQASQLRGRYDLAVVLRPDHWWGALLAAVAGIPERIGYATPLTRPFLTEALPLPPHTHAVRLSLNLAAQAARRGDPVGRPYQPLFRLTPDERAWAAAIAQQTPGSLVLLHPGSGSPLKNWPPERWARVADALAERGARVVVSGGADDPAGPRAVAAAMRHQPLVLVGSTSLGQLGALAERCALALGADSGPLHLAAALGTPTLRLYGPTDEATFGPWGRPNEHRALTHALPCRPCGNLLTPPCGAQREPPCLLGLETERVVEAALAHLATGRPAPTRESA